MKLITLILVTCVISQTVFSQDIQLPASSSKKEMKTILGNDAETHKIPIGYFFEISAGRTQFGQF
jgi:hypothetical protein